MLIKIKHGEDIIGKEYSDLIEWCFKNAVCFSLRDYRYRGENDQRDRIILDLSPYQILKNETTYYQPQYNECLYEYTKNIKGKTPTFHLYRCCNETKRYLLNECDSLYSWFPPKLEDLCFYYDDTHVLLYTESHESICKLSLKKPEMFDTLPNKQRWIIEDYNYIDQEWNF